MHSLIYRVRLLLRRFSVRVYSGGRGLGMGAEYLGSGVTLLFLPFLFAPCSFLTQILTP